jgi:hypothetical protein
MSMAKSGIPLNLGGRSWWWIWHREDLCICEYAWFAGPFDTQLESETFRDIKLVHPNSCPGCGQTTPSRTDYDIGQM